MAGAAARSLPRAACRHRAQHRHHARPGEFRCRWRGCGDPPWPRPLSRPALRPHRQHRHDTGLQPAAARLARRSPAAIPADLLGLPLLHDAERQDWALWFQAHGVADLGHAASSGISFDDQMLLIRAAASHQGIALVTETLARPNSSRAVSCACWTSPGRRSFPIGWCVRARPPTSRRSSHSATGWWRRAGGSARPRVQPGEQRGAERLEALVVHRRLRQRAHRLRQTRRRGRAW